MACLGSPLFPPVFTQSAEGASGQVSEERGAERQAASPAEFAWSQNPQMLVMVCVTLSYPTGRLYRQVAKIPSAVHRRT